MKFIRKINAKWLRNLGYTLSLTTVAFIFQACYGPRRDFASDVFISGRVIDGMGKPIEGIRISNDSTEQYSRSDSAGYFQMYLPIADTHQYIDKYSYKLIFEDDSNSKYTRRDTTLNFNSTFERVLIQLKE